MNSAHLTVSQLIKQQKEHAEMRGRKFIVKKPPRQRHPINLERKYFKELGPIISKLKEINSQIKQRLALVLEKANDLRPSFDSFGSRLDGYSEEIQAIIDAGYGQFVLAFSDSAIEILARRIALDVNEFNADQFDKTFKASLGVDPFASEPWLAQELEGFIKDNVALIKTIPEGYFSSVKGIVSDGARSGRLMSNLAADIDKRTEVGKSRAKFIARDQVSKFNGDLNHLRQKSVGINSYIWSTSLDERVRPTHAANEGKKFSWDKPPSETGHPGEDYQCRCVALAVFEE
jgi:SPP1 gp7 family putative phage head morphogenesis protein